MTKTILCAMDMSQATPDDRVLNVAAELARNRGARLDVMTVLPDFGIAQVTTFFPEGYQEKARSSAIEALKAHVSKVLGDDPEFPLRCEVAIGKVYAEVLAVAADVNADLIVVGSQDPGLQTYLIGSNAVRIVRHAHCSVYVVR